MTHPVLGRRMTTTESNSHFETASDLILIVESCGRIASANNEIHPLFSNKAKSLKNLSSVFESKTLSDFLLQQHLSALQGGSTSNSCRLEHDELGAAEIRVSSQLMTADNGSNQVLHRISVINAERETSSTTTTDRGTSYAFQVEKRNDLLSALNNIAVRMMDQKPIQGLLQIIADSIMELTEADSSYINLAKSDGEYLELVAVSGDQRTQIGFKTNKGQGLSGKVLQSKKMEYSSNYNKIRNRIKAFDSAKQACALPLIVSGRIVGVLGFVMEQEAESLFNQIDVVQQFATLASIAIENSMLLEETRNELLRNQSMNALSTAVFENDSFDELLQITIRTIENVVNTVSVSVWSIKNRTSIEKLNVEGYHTATEKQKSIPVVNDSFLVLQWLSSMGSKADNPGSQDLYITEENCGDIERQKHVLIPCFIDDTTDIVFHIGLENGNEISESIQPILKVIGTQFSTAVSRQALQRKVTYQAFHDGLTELPNRIQFDLSLNETVQNRLANQQPFSILFIDLDGFKNVNDTFGHNIGDQLLVEVSRRFQQQMKDDWMLARIGGDEFAAIIKREDCHARAVAESIVLSLEAKFNLKHSIESVGASVGVSHFPLDGASSFDLLKKADMAMYHAKRNGKNQVVMYSDLEWDKGGTEDSCSKAA